MRKGTAILLLSTLFIAMSIFKAVGQDAETEPSIVLKDLITSENHIGVLNYIDSLHQVGEYYKEHSWLYATTLFHAGRLSQARDSLLKWEDDSLFATRAKNLLTQIAVQQRDYMEAVRYLIKLGNRYPDNPVYPHRLARAFNAMNQLPAAEGNFSKAHRLDTLNQIIIAEWVDVLVKLDFHQRASWILDRGIKIAPENLGFRRQKVILSYRGREYETVLENAEFLTQQGDTTPQIMKLKGFALFNMDSIDRAEFWIDYLIDNGFVGEDVYFYKGKILAARDKKHEAQPYFHLAAISCLSANFNPFALQAGINLYETGQYQESIRWLQMTRNFSQNPMITFYLALNFYDFYEDKAPALSHFRMFLEQSHSENQQTHRDFAKRRINEIVEQRHFQGYEP